MKLRFMDFRKKWNAEKKKNEVIGSVYAIEDITPEELALYKEVKSVDGENYYREQFGKPMWYDREFYGFDCCEVRIFERADGTKGFKTSQPMVEALQVLAEQTDDAAEKSRLLSQANLLKLSGKPFNPKVKADAIVDEQVEENEEEFEEENGL